MHDTYFFITFKILFADGHEAAAEQPFVCKAGSLEQAKAAFGRWNSDVPGCLRYQILDVKSYRNRAELMAALV